MSNIHPTAIVHPSAKIADNVTIGAYCVIGENVKISCGSKIFSHVVIDGYTTIGEDNEIYSFASIGSPPQDLKFAGEKTKLIIGKNNVIREYVTMNPGTKGGGEVTKIGNNNLFMVKAHVGHDSIIGNDNVFANSATLGGHVEIADSVIIGGMCAIHQFVRIGKNAIIGGYSAVVKDVLPFACAQGNRATISGVNIVGLRRKNIKNSEIRSLQDVFSEILESVEGSMAERLSTLGETYIGEKNIQELITFAEATSRGLCQFKPEDKIDG